MFSSPSITFPTPKQPHFFQFYFFHTILVFLSPFHQFKTTFLLLKLKASFLSYLNQHFDTKQLLFSSFSAMALVVIRVAKKTVFAVFTCVIALGGAIVGTIVGAMKGQTTETGFFRGAGVGAVAGAITAVQLLESMADGESLSKLALLSSLVSGKVFTEWVSPAVLKAYQYQMNSLESYYREMSDIYDVNGVKGLSKSSIKQLPVCVFQSSQSIITYDECSCSICLQELKEDEMVRKLPKCGHFFHVKCIDEWLIRQGTCPMCREHVFSDVEEDDE